MGLSFGWRVNDEREGIWIDDPALSGVTESARADWEKDGSAIHLLPFATNGKPTVFKWRALNVAEARYMKRLFADWQAGMMGVLALECFALGVRFPDAQEAGPDRGGAKVTTMVRDKAGFHRLSESFLSHLDATYPEMIDKYGALIFNATVPSEPEKKASSPGSTVTPSSAVANTGDGTGGPNGVAAAPAA